ncbi:MAG: hypothetical protein P1U39_00815 [Legionellaceae bacterium]|nr:hypothetical protein [Legionellaceae bacterium]
MDAPPKSPETYVKHAYYSEKLAYDGQLDDLKRGIMIDRITLRGTEQDLVPKLLNLYNETDNTEVRYRIISGLMSYNQTMLSNHAHARDEALLRQFFFRLLHEKVSPASSNDVALGFIQTHSIDQIMENLDAIDAQLKVSSHHDSVMTKYMLVHESKALQDIYIQSILDELREASSVELDDYFFGPLAIGFNASGKALLSPENTKLIMDYLNEVDFKYTTHGISKHSHTDPSYGITSMDYEHLRNVIEKVLR